MLMLIMMFLKVMFLPRISVTTFPGTLVTFLLYSMMTWNCIYQKSMEIFLFEITPLGMSLMFLTVFITLLCMINSFLTNMFSGHFLKLLLIMMMILSLLFFTDNIFSFYCLFEVSLVPIFLLIMGWGYQPERLLASKWMLMYTLTASIPLLLLIFCYHEFFNLPLFSAMNSFTFSPGGTPQNQFFSLKTLILLAGFLVKFPIFFMHTWLPRAHVEAPVSGSMLLAAILLKLAGFGVFRFLPLISSLEILLLVKSFSVFGGGLISIICLFEKDMKKLIAYTSVAHMCFVIFAYLSKSQMAVSAASLMMIAHGVCSSGLFAGANQMASFSNSRSLLFNQGVLSVWPSFTLFWFFMCLGNMGGPPSINFFAEIFCILSLIQNSLFSSFPVMVLTFFAAGYSLILYSNSQYGRLKKKEIFDLKFPQHLSNFLHLSMLLNLSFFLIF